MCIRDSFNTEENVKVTPDATTKYIDIPSNYLRYDLHDKRLDKTKDLVRRMEDYMI